MLYVSQLLCTTGWEPFYSGQTCQSNEEYCNCFPASIAKLMVLQVSQLYVPKPFKYIFSQHKHSVYINETTTYSFFSDFMGMCLCLFMMKEIKWYFLYPNRYVRRCVYRLWIPTKYLVLFHLKHALHFISAVIKFR